MYLRARQMVFIHPEKRWEKSNEQFYRLKIYYAIIYGEKKKCQQHQPYFQFIITIECVVCVHPFLSSFSHCFLFSNQFYTMYTWRITTRCHNHIVVPHFTKSSDSLIQIWERMLVLLYPKNVTACVDCS